MGLAPRRASSRCKSVIYLRQRQLPLSRLGRPAFCTQSGMSRSWRRRCELVILSHSFFDTPPGNAAAITDQRELWLRYRVGTAAPTPSNTRKGLRTAAPRPPRVGA